MARLATPIIRPFATGSAETGGGIDDGLGIEGGVGVLAHAFLLLDERSQKVAKAPTSVSLVPGQIRCE